MTTNYHFDNNFDGDLVQLWSGSETFSVQRLPTENTGIPTNPMAACLSVCLFSKYLAAVEITVVAAQSWLFPAWLLEWDLQITGHQ